MAFAGLAVLMIFIQPFASAPLQDVAISSRESILTAGNAEPMSAEIANMKAMPDYYRMPPYNDDIAITDDREFLKMTYQATIQARNPGDMTKRARTAVHAFDGRIDSMSSSEKYGQITFALPAEKFDAFQLEIQSLTRSKLIVENISAQNLLPQKVLLEQQKKSDQKLLADVATVHGTISVRLISIPEVVALYVGPYWLAILLGVLALITFIINRVRTSRIVLPA